MVYGYALMDWQPDDRLEIGEHSMMLTNIPTARLIDEHPIGSKVIDNEYVGKITQYFKNTRGQICIAYEVIGYVEK